LVAILKTPSAITHRRKGQSSRRRGISSRTPCPRTRRFSSQPDVVEESSRATCFPIINIPEFDGSPPSRDTWRGPKGKGTVSKENTEAGSPPAQSEPEQEKPFMPGVPAAPDEHFLVS